MQIITNTTHARHIRTHWSGLLLFAVAGLVIYFGWHISPERYITAEEGAGYALGIIGGVMMLMLLLYPLRKRARWMRNLGQIRYWFAMHMFCGLFGPIAILYHSNFSLGSLNSNVALFAMLTVAGSGIFGRYFYTRIHYGLYGRKASLNELKEIASDNYSHFSSIIKHVPEAEQTLSKYEKYALSPVSSTIRGLFRAIYLSFATRIIYHQLKRKLFSVISNNKVSKKTINTQQQEVKYYLHSHLFTLRQIAEYSFYERLFSWWHILHLPLFIMLIISGITHVVAVHMY